MCPMRARFQDMNVPWVHGLRAFPAVLTIALVFFSAVIVRPMSADAASVSSLVSQIAQADDDLSEPAGRIQYLCARNHKLVVPIVLGPAAGFGYDPTSPETSFEIEVQQPPRHGGAKIHEDGSFTYTPAPGHTGPDEIRILLKSQENDNVVRRVVDIKIDCMEQARVVAKIRESLFYNLVLSGLSGQIDEVFEREEVFELFPTYAVIASQPTLAPLHYDYTAQELMGALYTYARHELSSTHAETNRVRFLVTLLDLPPGGQQTNDDEAFHKNLSVLASLASELRSFTELEKKRGRPDPFALWLAEALAVIGEVGPLISKLNSDVRNGNPADFELPPLAAITGLLSDFSERTLQFAEQIAAEDDPTGHIFYVSDDFIRGALDFASFYDIATLPPNSFTGDQEERELYRQFAVWGPLVVADWSCRAYLRVRAFEKAADYCERFGDIARGQQANSPFFSSVSVGGWFPIDRMPTLAYLTAASAHRSLGNFPKMNELTQRANSYVAETPVWAEFIPKKFEPTGDGTIGGALANIFLAIGHVASESARAQTSDVGTLYALMLTGAHPGAQSMAFNMINWAERNQRADFRAFGKANLALNYALEGRFAEVDSAALEAIENLAGLGADGPLDKRSLMTWSIAWRALAASARAQGLSDIHAAFSDASDDAGLDLLSKFFKASQEDIETLKGQTNGAFDIVFEIFDYLGGPGRSYSERGEATLDPLLEEMEPVETIQHALFRNETFLRNALANGITGAELSRLSSYYERRLKVSSNPMLAVSAFYDSQSIFRLCVVGFEAACSAYSEFNLDLQRDLSESDYKAVTSTARFLSELTEDPNFVVPLGDSLLMPIATEVAVTHHDISGNWRRALDLNLQAVQSIARVVTWTNFQSVVTPFGQLEVNRHTIERYIARVALGSRRAEDIDTHVEEAFRLTQLAIAGRTSKAAGLLQTWTGASDLKVSDGIRGRLHERRRFQTVYREKLREIAAALAANDADHLAHAVRSALSDQAAYFDLFGSRHEMQEYAENPPISLEQAQEKLSEDDALLLFMIGSGQGYAWVVRHDSASLTLLPDANAANLEALQRRFRRSIPDALTQPTMFTFPTFDFSAMSELYDVLLDPLEPHLEGVQHLMIVPDGPLYSMPFETLIFDPVSDRCATTLLDIPDFNECLRTAEWLVGKYAISVLPAVGLLETSIRYDGPETVLTVGAPQAAPSRRDGCPDLSGFPSIPSAGATILDPKFYSDLGLRVSHRLIGDAASEANLRQVASAQNRIAVFLTHGVQPDDVGAYEQPALLLSPSESCEQNDDGLLFSGEISELNMNADWVILAACSTASSDGTGTGEQLSGFGAAFFGGGARSLLVSHWPVYSRPTVTFVQNTLKYYLGGERLRKDEAVQRAKLDLIRGNEGRHAHPVFWAAFSFVGDGGASLGQ